VNQTSLDSCPASRVYYCGSVDLLQLFVASGRKITWFDNKKQIILVLWKNPDLSSNYKLYGMLLTRYLEFREKCVDEEREKTGFNLRRSAALYALFVFASDQFLSISKSASSKEERFFKIAIKLPLELQMLLALRVFGKSGTLISSEKTQRAIFLLGSSFPLNSTSFLSRFVDAFNVF